MEILEINVEVRQDTCPDLSYLGEFGDEWKKYAIDRKRMGTWKRGECRYFYSANSPKPEMSSKEKHIAWDQCEYDFWCMERYMRDWVMLEVCATAKVAIFGVTEKITSGCTKVESDSDDEFILSIKQSELLELKSILKEIDFSDEEIEEIKVGGLSE